LGNPVRFSDPSGMIEEDQDGLMSVSTDLWGGGRNQSFMDQSASDAKANAQTTQLQQAGYIVTGSGSSNVQTGSGSSLKDLTTYKVDFNKHAGKEVMRELKDGEIDISYEGKFVTKELKPNENMLAKYIGRGAKFYNMKNAAYTKLAYDSYSIMKFSATVGKFGQAVGYAGFIATSSNYYLSHIKTGGEFGMNPQTILLTGDLALNRAGVSSPQGFLFNLAWEIGKAGGRYKNHLEKKYSPGGEDGLLSTDY